ncbi:MAG: hypothetical protein QXS85_06030 [Acidilobaceae archaeon]
MPRVDVGLYAMDLLSSSVDKALAGVDIDNFVKWVIEERALVVTSSSIVTVRVERERVASIVLGVGSVISKSKPPLSHASIWQIASTSWVDGCVASEESRVEVVEAGSVIEIEGVVRAIDIRDPVALSINGVKGRHAIARVSVDRASVVAVVDNLPVVVREGPYYRIALHGGPARDRALLVARLVSACGGASR